MLDYKLTVKKIERMLYDFKTKDFIVFKRLMQNRRIPEMVWRPIVEKDEDAIRRLLYDSKPISDENFQEEALPMEQDLAGEAGRIMPSPTDQWPDDDNHYTSGEKEWYSHWQ